MRLGVIDVGSNTVHLLVVDATAGGHPMPDFSHKTVLRLAEHTLEDGSISEDGARLLTEFVGECVDISEDRGNEELLAFATSAIRDAPNTEEVLARVRKATGVDLMVLPGEEESRLTFLAARRWFGWSSGRLLLFDIGGGSLEIAAGLDEEPDVAVSLPLGAGRLTRELDGDPPKPKQIKALRKQVRSDVAKVARDVAKVGAPDRVVAASKTFRTLARLCGAAPSADGPYAPRSLNRGKLSEMVAKLAEMPAADRTDLPGVSSARAQQILAGGIVAEAAMDILGVDDLDICPWALREGFILRRLDLLT